ncbi:MAG: Hin recombinase [Actinobacteria bacterium]|nr:Hin recombinase [Actinomycetota bacterium]MCA1806363.1 Hin recombinase [Actinomycetota bacterium]
MSDKINEEKLYSHKLTPQQVQEMFYMHQQGQSYSQLARHFKIHRNTVYNILQRIRNEKLKGA